MVNINQQAPVVVSGKIQIKAKPQKVWSVLTDIDRWNQWLKNVSQSKLNGELMPNTTFDWKAGGTRIHSKLHTVVPWSFIGWTGQTMSIQAIHNWSIEEKGEITEVFVEESMEGWLASLFKGYLKKMLGKDMLQSLGWLKEECEKK